MAGIATRPLLGQALRHLGSFGDFDNRRMDTIIRKSLLRCTPYLLNNPYFIRYYEISNIDLEILHILKLFTFWFVWLVRRVDWPVACVAANLFGPDVNKEKSYVLAKFNSVSGWKSCGIETGLAGGCYRGHARCGGTGAGGCADCIRFLDPLGCAHSHLCTTAADLLCAAGCQLSAGLYTGSGTGDMPASATHLLFSAGVLPAACGVSGTTAGVLSSHVSTTGCVAESLGRMAATGSR